MGFADLINRFYETLGKVLVGGDFKLHEDDRAKSDNPIDRFLKRRKQKMLEQEINIALRHVEQAKENYGKIEARVYVVPREGKGYWLYQFPMRSVFVVYGFKDREREKETPKDPELEMLLGEQPERYARYSTQAKDEFAALSAEEKDKAMKELLRPYNFLGSAGSNAEKYHNLIRKMFASELDLPLNKARHIATDICMAGSMADFHEIFEHHFEQYDDLYE